MDPLHPNTQRVVLLIDLQPLFSPQNPNPTPSSYFAPILSSIRRIVSSPQLASSLSALKFVFSNLSPISSSSKTHSLLGKCPSSLSFNDHSKTLIALSETLELISSIPNLSNLHINGASKASLLAKLLLQLENEYAWEAKRNTETDQGLLRSGSNLIIFFSPVPQDANILSQFVDLEGTVDRPVVFHDFAKKFLQIFCPVKERLDLMDISLSWVRVDFEIVSDKEIAGSSWFEGVIREQNWGFSSTDAIVLGSSIIPIGLIFPFIGCSIGHKHGRNSEIAPLELILEISDANGKPLECQSCQLEALHVQIIDNRSVNMSPSFQNFGREITKVCVKGVKKIGDSERILKNASSMVIIHGFSRKLRENTQNGAEFFPDKILQHFCTEKGELVREMPIWQLFLSFLYSRNYSAMVSVPGSNGACFEGVLIPFTINHGLLYVLEEGFLETERCRCGLLETKGEKRKRKQVIEHLLESHDFITFRDIALSHSEAGVLGDICDLYFHKFSSKLKKLKFLKCWVSQMRESCTGSCNLTAKERESEVEAENIQPQKASFEDKMHKNEGVSPFSSVVEAEVFLGSIEEKIEKDLVLEDGNLGISVENFVHLIIDAVSRKVGGEGQGVGLEAANLILKKPKDLLAKYRGSSYSTNYKLREHEVQILIRLEILKSVAGSHIEETRKQRMIREICLLLQFIDLNLQNSSCVATSIIDFVERTIKSRYAHSIPYIVQQIYSQMEFDMSEQDETFYSPNNTDPDNMSEPKIEQLSIHEQIDEMMEKKKLKARERIDRQRRFKSFTSWTPDLHRVWALKQPKFERNGLDLRPPSSSRRKKRRLSGNFVVCETPMTGMKETTSGMKTPNRSLSKALFHDEFDAVQASPCTDTSCG